ncbi:MAG: hypothetical protein DMD48_09830 [Gemmatimonadetes bacterium]|nr:MAG: hypothetical protein DMD48_09830 [Gemmatimonadota bacterium]
MESSGLATRLRSFPTILASPRHISTSMWYSKEIVLWTAGTSSVADDSAAPFLRGPAAVGLWSGGQLGIRLFPGQVRAARRSDIRPQVSLDSARVSAGISDGRNVSGLSDRRRRGRLAGAAQPATRGRACNTQPGSALMKAMLTLLLLVGFVGQVAAQDTTKAAAPAPAPAAAAAAAANASVEAVLARSVVDRVPQDTGTAFPDSVGTVVLWMRVSGASGQTVSAVWFHGGDEVGTVPLAIGGSPWRTWSRKTIPVDATGAWHVEIRDAAGNVLKRVDFTVGQ